MHLQSHAKKKHKGTWLCAVTTRSAKYLTKQTTPTPAGRNFTLWPKSLGPLCFHPAAALLFGTFCTCFIYYSGYSCPKILQSTKCTIAIPLPSHCHPIAIVPFGPGYTFELAAVALELLRGLAKVRLEVIDGLGFFS